MKFSKEEEYLRRLDKKLKKLIDVNGHIVFKPNKKNQFDSLTAIVIAQFISTSAANTIYENIKDFFNTKYLSAKDFQNLKINQIKKFGLSQNKARTIKELSEIFLDKNFYDLTKLDHHEMNEKLLSVFGIGPWSVNMFEIFCSGNLDIFSSKDAGLRSAMNNYKMIKSDSDWNKYDEYAKKWSPYRTIASLHLWKSVD